MHNESDSDDQRGESIEPTAARSRDVAARRRDVAAGERDDVGDTRDQAGEDRDAAADQRDRESNAQDLAERSRHDRPGDVASDLEQHPAAPGTFDRSARARRAAADDRSSAAEDRQSGAIDRTSAELDRGIASTDREASERDRTEASTDHLTGVHDRRSGYQALASELDRARRTGETLVLAFIDVDGLKSINDAHGHAAGDRVLVDVATTLKAHLRSYDLVMRYGGDEFVCALPATALPEATARFAVINDILAQLPEPPVAVSVGLAELLPGDSVQDLTARADADLYATRYRHRSSDLP